MAPPKRPIPDDFATRVVGMPFDQARAYWRAGDTTIQRWAAEAGVRLGRSNPRHHPTPPENFRENARRSPAALRAEFGWTAWQVRCWRRALDIRVGSGESLRGSRVPPAPPDFVERRREMTIAQLCAHYDRGKHSIRKWIEETGARAGPVSHPAPPPRPKPARARNVPLAKSRVPLADMSTTGRAMMFLRRKFARVFSAEILPEGERASLPNKGRGIVIVGNLRVPKREIVAFAVERGMPA